ncbi:5692_t:CDS:1 [Funneliformis caledonium]|uniref:5692_t:CDS:1 n=1 Tax=Funneliformis caledonium TaxID=1117310 RepID=A0A9N9EF60_9GLOM|nr:5692_t:CDS:1 [Funneliformis caledonium]
MSRVGTIIAIIAVSVSLVILLLSYAGAKVDVDIPQDNNTRTGYPVWHPPFPGHYGQDQYATIFASIILMGIGGYYAYKWTLFDTKTDEELVTYLVDNAFNKTTSIYFDQLLAAYSLITGLTGIAYLAFDLGKMWSTVGVFHNGLEVVILVALHQGGRIVSNKFLAWMILYFVSTLGFSIFLDWPYDTVWFKMQGLCQDFALAITFTRIYFDTRNGYGDETHQRLSDVERPREHNHVKEYTFGSVSRFIPNFVLFLVLASYTHILGNVYATILYTKYYSYLVLSFTYCITFPIYCYFVYLDTHSIATPPSQKYIILPDTSKPKVVLVTLSVLFLSFLCTRLSLYYQSDD